MLRQVSSWLWHYSWYLLHIDQGQVRRYSMVDRHQREVSIPKPRTAGEQAVVSFNHVVVAGQAVTLIS